MSNYDWGYPNTVWFGNGRIKDLQKACNVLGIKNPLFVSCAEKTGFRRLNPDEPLIENDVLCMNMVGNGLHHVALFTKGEVLHHLTDRLSCREPYSAWLQKCTGAKYRYDN